MQLRTQRSVPINAPLPEVDHDIWRPTRPSLGSREPALRSRAASTGFVVEDECVINFESRLERYAGEVFALDPEIANFVEQPPRISYRDGASLFHHTFDFLTVRATGRRTLVAIKHSRRVVSSGIRRVIGMIAEQAGRSVADEIALMTELDFSPNERFNAELSHEIRRHPVPEHDDHLRQVTAGVQGVVTVRDVVSLSGLGAYGFRAVVRLLAARFFLPAEKDCRIDYDARIRRSLPHAAN